MSSPKRTIKDRQKNVRILKYHRKEDCVFYKLQQNNWIHFFYQELLEKNMIITIEPGVYIPNKFGVRIEDSIVVGEKTKNLNRYTKKMIIL